MPAFNPAKTVESVSADYSGRPEQSYFTCIADVGEYDVQTVTFDTAANINQGEFFVLSNAAGTTWGVWFDIDANGTESTGATYSGTDNQIEVDIAGSDTAAQVAAKVETAIAGVTDITTDDSAADGTMTITQDKLGPADVVTFYDADSTAYSGGGALAATTDNAGVASNLQNKYCTFRNAANSAFYAWFNVASEGSDPSETGTAIEVAIDQSATAAAVATALATAINANANFESEADGTVVKVTNAAEGNATDIGAGDSGFTATKVVDGAAEVITPSTVPGSISLNPSA